MALNFGSQKTKQSIQEPGTEERALTSANTELAQLQLQQMKDQIAQQNAPKTSLQLMQDQLEEAATKNLLARATGQAPILTPEQQGALDQMFSLTSKRASQDLTQYGQEIAAQRGMTTADSPIGNELLRQQRDLQEGLAATKTKASLDLGASSDLFNQNLQQFQAQLRQQAYQNRLMLSTEKPASYGQQNMLLAQRMPYMNTIQRGTSGGLSGGEGSSAGSSMSGIAALAALA